MNEVEDSDDRDYVIVRWIDGMHQIRKGEAQVIEFLKTEGQISMATERMTLSEARALLKLYPQDQRIRYGIC